MSIGKHLRRSVSATVAAVLSLCLVLTGCYIPPDDVSNDSGETSAVNKLTGDQHIVKGRDDRIVAIVNYIHKNYKQVTLDDLVQEFHLSKPYLSKYIKDKAGSTFQDMVRGERMKKARALLKETRRSVESIATEVGYENVEHFNRLFKKSYGMTPVQYRKS